MPLLSWLDMVAALISVWYGVDGERWEVSYPAVSVGDGGVRCGKDPMWRRAYFKAEGGTYLLMRFWEFGFLNAQFRVIDLKYFR